MRDFETVCNCIYRDCGILMKIWIRSPCYPRHDLYRLVDLLLDAASIVERLAMGVDSYGELHEKTPGVNGTGSQENCHG